MEFLDRNGHTAKCFGNLRLDLHDAAPAGRSRGTLATWNLDLTDLDVNTVHYDDITRTYLFKLEVSDTDLPQEPELRLYYIAADGRLIDTRGSAPSAQPIGS